MEKFEFEEAKKLREDILSMLKRTEKCMIRLKKFEFSSKISLFTQDKISGTTLAMCIAYRYGLDNIRYNRPPVFLEQSKEELTKALTNGEGLLFTLDNGLQQ